MCSPHVLTLSAYCDHTVFRKASNSPFFLIVCNRLSMDERCTGVSGRSEVLNCLRGTMIGSSIGGASGINLTADMLKMVASISK